MVADRREGHIRAALQQGIRLRDTCLDVFCHTRRLQVERTAQRRDTALNRERGRPVQLAPGKGGEAAEICCGESGINSRFKPFAQAVEDDVAFEAIVAALQIQIGDAQRLVFDKIDLCSAVYLCSQGFGQRRIRKRHALGREVQRAQKLADIAQRTGQRARRAQNGLRHFGLISLKPFDVEHSVIGIAVLHIVVHV